MTVPPLTLVLFDVDGTLVDSQAHIMLAMQAAFAGQGLECPARERVLSIVGLSLDRAFSVLAPGLDTDVQRQLVDGYKNAFVTARIKNSAALSPLYPGALACLNGLGQREDMVLGVATGKSKRGLDHMIEMHGLSGRFVTQQVADFHPSKPHPSMALTAIAESGADRGVMIGDTTYDMEMGRAAGLKTIGVSWGYHDASTLWGLADQVVDHFDDLTTAIHMLWGE